MNTATYSLERPYEHTHRQENIQTTIEFSITVWEPQQECMTWGDCTVGRVEWTDETDRSLARLYCPFDFSNGHNARLLF